MPNWLSGKESTCNAEDIGDMSLIHGSRRSPGGGHGSPLQYSHLENLMDRGAWQDTIHRVTTSWTQLSMPACTMTHAAAKSPQSCPTLCDPIDGSPKGSSIPGILQARTLELVAMPSSRGSFQPRGQTQVSCVFCITGGFFTAEPLGKSQLNTIHP